MHCQNDSCWQALNWPSARAFPEAPFKLSLVPFYIVQNFRLKNEKCSVDPTLRSLRLFRKADNPRAIKIEMTVTRRRPHRGQGCELAVRSVKIKELAQVEI